MVTSSKEIAMGAKMGTDKLELICHDTVDEHKVGLYMAIPEFGKSPFERMILLDSAPLADAKIVPHYDF